MRCINIYGRQVAKIEIHRKLYVFCHDRCVFIGKLQDISKLPGNVNFSVDLLHVSISAAKWISSGA
jgi:hypothetical protein